MKALEKLENLTEYMETLYDDDVIDWVVYRELIEKIDDIMETLEEEYGANS